MDIKWQRLITDIYECILAELETALDGLTVDDLNQRPRPDCNCIGWLVWHLTRVQDTVVEDLMGEEQLWIKDNWHTKFSRIPDPTDTGEGHSLEELEAFRSPDSDTLLEYHLAVLKHTKRYLTDKLSETDLKREFENPTYPTIPTVSACLVGVINDNLQHVGQVAYIRGLLKGKGWSDI